MASNAPTTGAPTCAPKTLDWLAQSVQADLCRIETLARAICEITNCANAAKQGEALGDAMNLAELIITVTKRSGLDAEQLELAAHAADKAVRHAA